jgi:hypothetical protein
VSDRDVQLRCIYCNGARLMAPHEPVAFGSIVICGSCGSLMVADTEEVAGFDLNSGPNMVERAILRRPSNAEARDARQDPAVVAALDAFNLVTLERLTSKKSKRIAPRRGPTLHLGGPEDGFVRAALLALVSVPFACLGIGFWFGFVAGAHFHP